MVSHANIMWTLESAVALLHIREGERLLSFLPLSHIAERMISDFAAVAVGAETWFARSLSTVAEDLRDCRPTVFFAVPRVWEKLQEAVTAKLGETHGLKRLVVDRYVDLGEHVVAEQETAGPRRRVWEKLPVRGARRRGRAQDPPRDGPRRGAHPDLRGRADPPRSHPLVPRHRAAGHRALRPDRGVRTDHVQSARRQPGRHGRAGRSPASRVRIADDGEILVQGGNVCVGYFHDPAATAELIDDDGWMHSGDVGRLDEHGYLTVTGRKKDLIITAHGQNIAPQEIETDLRQHDLISEAVVIGEGRRYLTALLTLDGDALARWAEAHHKVADVEALAVDPDLRGEIDRFVDAVNGKRSRVEQVRKYRILAHDFTIAAGEMTPTLKVKRNVVNADYADVIDEMYAEQ